MRCFALLLAVVIALVSNVAASPIVRERQPFEQGSVPQAVLQAYYLWQNAYRNVYELDGTCASDCGPWAAQGNDCGQQSTSAQQVVTCMCQQEELVEMSNCAGCFVNSGIDTTAGEVTAAFQQFCTSGSTASEATESAS